MNTEKPNNDLPSDLASNKQCRVLGVSGRSGSGKTTLIEAMLPIFETVQWRVNVVKHSHHDIELEPPAKDSSRLRMAGAQEVMVSSPHRFSLSHELRGAPEPSLDELISRMQPCDLVLVEGYHSAPIPRIEVYRPSLERPPQYDGLTNVIALVSDELQTNDALAVWPLNNPLIVVQNIMRWFAVNVAFNVAVNFAGNVSFSTDRQTKSS